MTSLKAKFCRFYFKWIMRSKAMLASPERMRETMTQGHLYPDSFNPPKSLGSGITITRIDVNDWPLYKISASSGSSSEEEGKTRPAAMLYIHGGSFFKEIIRPHWNFIAQVVRDTGLDVLVPIYPLVPRPAATAVRLTQGLLHICNSSEQPIVCIAGDSAGGMLAMATAQQLESGLAKQLRCLVLISPCLDTSLAHPELKVLEEDDPWLASEGLRALTSRFADGISMDDPRASPLFGDIEALPPVMMLCGTHDMLCADARRLSARYQGEGPDAGRPGSFKNEKLTYVEKEKMIHVYPLMPHKEGEEARRLIMRFINEHTKQNKDLAA